MLPYYCFRGAQSNSISILYYMQVKEHEIWRITFLIFKQLLEEILDERFNN